jgi:hypothetical protein
MADVIRIKRRTSGSPGAPATLANAELAYNEVDHILYYGEGTGGSGGSATVVVPVGGSGQASNTNPVMNGVAAAGAQVTYSRSDHVHPVDTSRAPLANPVFTGDPQAPTPLTADNDTSIATTAFVKAQLYATVASVPLPSSTNPLMDGAVAVGVGTTFARADHVHPTDSTRAPLASPVLTGNPTGPTPATADSSVSLATTAFVKAQAYAPLASPVLTGNPTGPTPANTDSSVSLATTAFVKGLRQDQFQPPTADVAWGNRKITGLADCTSPQDAATKNYVDGAIQGLNVTQPCRMATTANLAALSGLLTIDGIVAVAGDRVLVKDQTAQANNGIYNAAVGAWTRSTDTNTWTGLVAAYTFIEVGTANADNGYLCTSDPGGTLGTTPVTWVQFSGAGQIIGGAGLVKTGNQIDAVGTANRILVNADNIDIDPAYVGQTSITTLGAVATGTWNATTIAVNRGGSGAVTLTGYLKGNGAAAFTGVASIPNTDITGLGSMALQAASAVAITGGTIDGVTLDGGTF